MSFRELLESEFRPYGELAPDQLRALEDHYSALVRWNAVLNLTRIDAVEDAVRLHYCESLFLASQLPGGPLRVADVGSGAGFPGIPTAVLRPDLTVILVESHRRKAVFLREVCRGLENVSVAGSRAEDLREKFDWVISRAVLPDTVVELALAPRHALLVGPADAARFAASGWRSMPVPWGQGRFAVFHVEP